MHGGQGWPVGQETLTIDVAALVDLIPKKNKTCQCAGKVAS